MVVSKDSDLKYIQVSNSTKPSSNDTHIGRKMYKYRRKDRRMPSELDGEGE